VRTRDNAVSATTCRRSSCWGALVRTATGRVLRTRAVAFRAEDRRPLGIERLCEAAATVRPEFKLWLMAEYCSIPGLTSYLRF